MILLFAAVACGLLSCDSRCVHAPARWEKERQLCTLLGLMGRDYQETVSDSNSAWIHMYAEYPTVQAALENERSYIGVQVDPVTCRKPGHIETRRALRSAVFYADMSKWPPEDRAAFERKEAGKGSAAELFAKRVFHLTEVGKNHGPKNPHERRCWQVERLLAMPRYMLSQSTRLQLSKLHRQCVVAYRARERLSAQNDVAEPVTLQHGTFARHLEQLGWGCPLCGVPV